MIRPIVKASIYLLTTGALVACQPPLEDQPQLEVGQTARGMFSSVSSFGSNPGALRMYKYVPSNPKPNAALVVAMHACSQNASGYQAAGWNSVADRLGFYVIYPEQTSINNPAGCFNWAGEGYVGPRDVSNLERGRGENQSIISMIDKMIADHDIDTNKVYLMGHSGGAAQAALMAVLWPDRVAGAGIIAGIPYRCTTELLQVSACLSPGKDMMPQQWGDLARMGNGNYSGPYPKLSIWHGDRDNIVAIRNQNELVEQFTNFYGIDGMADNSRMESGATVAEYQDGTGKVMIETWTLPGFGHATPVDPAANCGSTGQYFQSAPGLCAAEKMAQFFGLDGQAPSDTEAPTVNITSPANGATVSGIVTVNVEAQDNVGVTKVDFFVNGNAAGSDTSAPFSFDWDTSSLAAGNYALRVVASDAAGNTGFDDDTGVTVSSMVMDTMPPVVSIDSPAEGATIMGTTQIVVTATDDYGVAEVELLVDGNSLTKLTSAPYSYDLDTTTLAAGTHTIAAQARDAAGNMASAMVSVTVDGGGMSGDTTPPTVSFSSPKAQDVLSGVVRIKAVASDDVRVAAVFLDIDGKRSGTVFLPPYEYIWDTRNAAVGLHTLVVTAADASGNTASDTIQIKVEAEQVQPDPMVGDPQEGDSRWGCSAFPRKRDAASVTILWLVGFYFMRRRLRQNAQR